MAKKILVKDYGYVHDDLTKESKSYLEVNGKIEIDNPEKAIADYIIKKEMI